MSHLHFSPFFSDSSISFYKIIKKLTQTHADESSVVVVIAVVFANDAVVVVAVVIVDVESSEYSASRLLTLKKQHVTF